jgi:IMP dehydrogenase/GMP reductase
MPKEHVASIYLDLDEPYSSGHRGVIAVSVGVKDEDWDNVRYYASIGVHSIVIDIAHCHSYAGIRMTDRISEKYPDILLVAGNVCTYEGALRLYEAGADIVKCGIGNGSVCSTKTATGVNVPQFTTNDDCWRAKMDYQRRTGRQVALIADGSVSKPADAVKALTRADIVMMGRAFASTKESAGTDTLAAVAYAGSSTFKSKYVEGKTETIYPEEWVDEVYTRYHEGIASGCSYMGASSVAKIQGWNNFVRVIR